MESRKETEVRLQNNMQCEHKLVPKVLLTFVTHSRWRRMNCKEVLEEIFADRDSDLSEESELESEWEVSESGENNSEPGEENESERIDKDDGDVNENNGVEADGGQQRGQNVGRGAHGPARGARGAVRGVHGVRRGVRGARRGARGATRGALVCGDLNDKQLLKRSGLWWIGSQMCHPSLVLLGFKWPFPTTPQQVTF